MDVAALYTAGQYLLVACCAGLVESDSDHLCLALAHAKLGRTTSAQLLISARLPSVSDIHLRRDYLRALHGLAHGSGSGLEAEVIYSSALCLDSNPGSMAQPASGPAAQVDTDFTQYTPAPAAAYSATCARDSELAQLIVADCARDSLSARPIVPDCASLIWQAAVSFGCTTAVQSLLGSSKVAAWLSQALKLNFCDCSIDLGLAACLNLIHQQRALAAYHHLAGDAAAARCHAIQALENTVLIKSASLLVFEVTQNHAVQLLAMLYCKALTPEAPMALLDDLARHILYSLGTTGLVSPEISQHPCRYSQYFASCAAINLVRAKKLSGPYPEGWGERYDRDEASQAARQYAVASAISPTDDPRLWQQLDFVIVALLLAGCFDCTAFWFFLAARNHFAFQLATETPDPLYSLGTDDPLQWDWPYFHNYGDILTDLYDTARARVSGSSYLSIHATPLATSQKCKLYLHLSHSDAATTQSPARSSSPDISAEIIQLWLLVHKDTHESVPAILMNTHEDLTKLKTQNAPSGT